MRRLADNGISLRPERPGRVWTETRDGRPRMARGEHRGKDVDAVPEHYLRWLLNEAELRPGPEEEVELREACCEIVQGASVRASTEEWTNVCVGHRSFSIPPGVAQLFDREMERLQLLFPAEWQAFEAMVACSSTTPLNGMD